MRMRISLAALALVGLFGCASPTIDERAAKDVSDLHANASGAFVNSSCGSGARFTPTCGLLSTFVSTEDFRTRYRDRRCPGHDDEGCQLAFQRAFDSWLAHRYYAADFKEVARSCDLYPARCQSAADFELRLLDSHNQHVRDQVIDADSRIEEQRQMEQARHRQAQAEVMYGVLRTIDYVTHDGPKCRSYPSMFGGVNTLCDR